MSGKGKLYGLRGFPHSNSKRKQIDRFREDREEIAEYTATLPTLRNGRQECPSLYDDVWCHEYTKKWETKPKSHNVKRDTIRRSDDDISDCDTE